MLAAAAAADMSQILAIRYTTRTLHQRACALHKRATTVQHRRRPIAAHTLTVVRVPYPLSKSQALSSGA